MDELLAAHVNRTCSLYSSRFGYRLGDVIRSGKISPAAQKQHDELYPDSIATDYMRATQESRIGHVYKRDHDEDRQLLWELIERHANGTLLPSSRTAVIHLRVGDVIDFEPASRPNSVFLCRALRTGTANNFYVRPLVYWSRVADDMIASGIHDATLVAGSHMKPTGATNRLSRSCQYVYAVGRYLEKRRISVAYRLGGDPDDDFVYISHARYFVPSGGGFSSVLARLVEEAGGKAFVLPAIGGCHPLCRKEDCVALTNETASPPAEFSGFSAKEMWQVLAIGERVGPRDNAIPERALPAGPQLEWPTNELIEHTPDHNVSAELTASYLEYSLSMVTLVRDSNVSFRHSHPFHPTTA